MSVHNNPLNDQRGGTNPLSLKVGDVAIVTNPGKNTLLTKGKKYTILEVLPDSDTDVSGVIIKSDDGLEQFYYAHRFTKVGGSFGTGKGTTDKIREFFTGKVGAYSASEIGRDLGLPGRQLNKRLAELIKRGELKRSEFGNFQRVTA